MLCTAFRLGIAIALSLASYATLLSDDRTDSPHQASYQASYQATIAQRDQDWMNSVRSALDKKLTIKYTDIELREFATKLTELTDQLWLIDRRALDDVGIGDDVPLTFEFSDMSVRSIMNHVLRELDLTWTVRDGALVVTTYEEAESRLSTRVIDVVDLISPFPDAPKERWDYDSLIELLTSTVAPQTWDTVGGPGSIEPYRGGIVVSQTRDVHEEIETLLTRFRAARKLAERHTASPPPRAAVGPADDNPVMSRIIHALNQFILLEYEDTPLHDVAEDLSTQCDINVMLDTRALDDVGIPADIPVSFRASRIRVHDALRHMLRSLDLTTVIRDEALIITIPEEAESRLVSAAYPVADLLGPTDGRDLFGEERRPADLDDLIQLVTSSIAPSSWDAVGGPGSIAACPKIDVLVISQTNDVHDQVADLFAKSRRHLAAQSDASDEQSSATRPAETRLVIYTVPSAEGQSDRPGKSGEESTGDQSRRAVPSDAIRSQMGMGGGMGGHVGVGSRSAPVNMLQAIIPESQLLGTIIELVEPNSWTERDDVYAKVLPGRLLIRHTEAVHRKIALLLNKLGVPFQTGTSQRAHFSWVFGGSM